MKTSISLVLDRRRTVKKTLHPICLFLTHKGTKYYINLGDAVESKFWDQENQKVLPGAKVKPTISYVNSHITRRKLDAEKMILRLEQTEELDTISALDLKYRITNKSARVSFYNYSFSLIHQFRTHGKDGNAIVYEETVRFLKRYTQKINELYFDEINYKLLKEIELKYLANKNSKNGLSHYLRTVRAIWNRAIREGIVKTEDYPFAQYRIQQEKFHKTALRKTDITRLWEIDVSEGTKAWHCRNVFFFSFYTQGMNLADIALLTKNNIQNSKISYQRAKTGKKITVPMSPKIQEILDKYPTDNDNERIFPIVVDLEKKQSQLRDFRNLGNHALKRWAKKLNLDPTLSFNTARHSWATIAKDLGVPITAIAQGLGHNEIATTQKYLDDFEDDVMAKVNELITG